MARSISRNKERGKVLYDLKVIGETDRTGTTIRFWPDVKDESDPEGIFETGDFHTTRSKPASARWPSSTAASASSSATSARKRRRRTSSTMRAHQRKFVKFINKNKEVLFPEPIYISGLVGTTSVEVAMQYNDTYSENIFAFVNNIHTPDGGTHLAGFQHGADPRHQRLWPQAQHPQS